jgi:hypothetical protein
MACGLVNDLGEGVSLARDVQRSGKANTVLDDWIKLSQVRFPGLIKDIFVDHQIMEIHFRLAPWSGFYIQKTNCIL